MVVKKNESDGKDRSTCKGGSHICAFSMLDLGTWRNVALYSWASTVRLDLGSCLVSILFSRDAQRPCREPRSGFPGRNRKVSIQARLVAQRTAHSQVIVLVMKASMTSMYTYSWHLALGLCKRGERKHTSLMEDSMPDDRGDSLASPLLRLKPSPDQEEHVRSARFSVVFAWNLFAMERYWCSARCRSFFLIFLCLAPTCADCAKEPTAIRQKGFLDDVWRTLHAKFGNWQLILYTVRRARSMHSWHVLQLLARCCCWLLRWEILPGAQFF